jgi:co-chaperonin GroES (HSP10)
MATQEATYYAAVTNAEVDGAIGIGIEDVVTCKGTILVSFPPAKAETEGGLHIPLIAQKAQDCGRVLSVPDDDQCPVAVGDFVLVRQMAGDPINLYGRKDLRFVQYTSDCSSEILAFIPACRVPECLKNFTDN